MEDKQIIECVPNFSEGRNPEILALIEQSMQSVDGARVIHVDPGKATHRTVMTVVGSPDAVIEAAYRGIACAIDHIDMNTHSGAHPRMGATDVCPLIPISGISMAETAEYAHKLAARVGQELSLPIYMYEAAATKPERKNLAIIRSGEYEGLEDKLKDPEWMPDYGPALKHPTAGATVIGARDFLVAYNVNLNTTSVRRANAIAFDVREKGRVLKKDGVIQRDDQGTPLRRPGRCKGVKAIGWYIDEYEQAQISMNLVDLNSTTLHEAYEACFDSALKRGLRVTGSELVGLIPKDVLLKAGQYYLHKQQRSTGIPEREIMRIAVKSLGLDEIGPFNLEERVIEYQLESDQNQRLMSLSIQSFLEETASESPAPGGGSVSALVGALGASLATMVANLSAHKRGWDDRWETFSGWAEKGEILRDRLMKLIDADTDAFNNILSAIRLPKDTEADRITREEAIQLATIHAIETPYSILRACHDLLEVIDAMVDMGNPNSITDAGVAALCTQAAAHGAFMNMQINVGDLIDEKLKVTYLKDGKKMLHIVQNRCTELTNRVSSTLGTA